MKKDNIAPLRLGNIVFEDPKPQVTQTWTPPSTWTSPTTSSAKSPTPYKASPSVASTSSATAASPKPAGTHTTTPTVRSEPTAATPTGACGAGASYKPAPSVQDKANNDPVVPPAPGDSTVRGNRTFQVIATLGNRSESHGFFTSKAQADMYVEIMNGGNTGVTYSIREKYSGE